MLAMRAHAKLTLSLEVLGRRGDGYHEVVVVLQSVTLADTISASPAAAVHVRAAAPGLSGPANLAWQAADLLRREAGLGFGALLTIEKAIPVAAGLGGGSANAAGALVLLNRFWELDWPSERLEALAARLGSDVPFALRGGTVLATGTGNEVESLPPLEETWFVLLTPPWQLPEKTARLYALLHPSHNSDGGRTRALAAALERRETLHAELLGNGFDAVAEEAFPGIESHRALLRGLSGQVVHLAGAGPTMFVVAPTRDVAEAWAGSLTAQGHEAYAVSTVDRGLVFFP
jgi:4-diphosphocytidyl-2-C-methyl-D-erythritol kinase